MALRTNTAEGGTNGAVIDETNVATITAGASGNNLLLDRSGGTITFSNAQAHRGTLSYRLAYAASQSQSLRYGSWGGAKSASIRAYHYLTTIVAGQVHSIQSFWTSSYGGAIGVSIDGEGRAILQSFGTTLYHPSAATFTFQTGRWYRIELAAAVGASTSTGTVRLAIYTGDNATPDLEYTSSTANTGPAADTIASGLFGRSNKPAFAYEHFIDNLAAADGVTDPIGPAPADAAAPPFPAETLGALRANTAEGGTDGTVITASAQTGGDSGTVIKYEATGASTIAFTRAGRQKGNLGYTFTYASQSRATLFWDGFSTDTYSVSTRSYHRLPVTVHPNAQTLIIIFNDTYGAVASLALNTEGKLIVQDADYQVIYTTETALLPDVWYRYEFSARMGTSTTNGRVRLAVFGGDDTVATYIFNTNVANTGLSPTRRVGSVYFGRNNNAPVAMVHHMDDIALQPGTSDLLGPTATALPPVSSAGSDRTGIEPYHMVLLTGTDSDPDGTVATRAWRQISGPTVIMGATATLQTAAYRAPATLTGTTLVFGYRVTDNTGLQSPETTVTHTILPVLERAVIGGAQVPMDVRAVMNGGVH